MNIFAVKSSHNPTCFGSMVAIVNDTNMDAKKNSGSVSGQITKGLGGKKNISDIDCCATRLRCTVHDGDLVDEKLLKATGASGVVRKGNGIQIIYGPKVTVIKSDLEEYLEQATPSSMVITSPITGTAMELSKVPDKAFAEKMLGDGVAVIPTTDMVYAPENGTVLFVAETKHAIGFQTDSGVSLLMHMGIDTVKLEGKGFEALVKSGQKVKKAEPLLKLDLEYLKKNAPFLASPVLCTELEEGQIVRLLKEGNIRAGEALFAIETVERSKEP